MESDGERCIIQREAGRIASEVGSVVTSSVANVIPNESGSKMPIRRNPVSCTVSLQLRCNPKLLQTRQFAYLWEY